MQKNSKRRYPCKAIPWRAPNIASIHTSKFQQPFVVGLGQRNLVVQKGEGITWICKLRGLTLACFLKWEIAGILESNAGIIWRETSVLVQNWIGTINRFDSAWLGSVMFRRNVFLFHFISMWAKFENKVGTTYAHKTETYWGLPSANSYLRQSFHLFCFAKEEEYVKTHVCTLHKCRQYYGSPTSIGTLILPY